MDDLRELDVRAAELLGWEKVNISGYEFWESPEGWKKYHRPPAYSTDPAACAELDGDMLDVGYECWEVANKDGARVIYVPHDRSISSVVDKYSTGKTRYEARTRAAVRALSGEGEK